METLTPAEQVQFKKLLIKGSICVLDLDTMDFTKFAEPIIGYDLCEKYQGFAAAILTEFLRNEKAEEVVSLMDFLIDYAIAKDDYFEGLNDIEIFKCREIIKKYSYKNQSYKLPSLDKEGLDVLEKDINRTLADNEYILAVDRLHTYSLYFFEDLCKKNNLTPNKDSKGHIMFDDMISQLQKKFEDQGVLNFFDKEAIKNSKEIFNKYNGIRNNRSYAHPNQIIENARAKFLINNIIILLNYFIVLNEECQKQISK